ncbi:ferredoxin family protein [Thermodesulfobacteriota bacterium]
MPPVIDDKLCIACSKCWEICEGDVFYGSKEGSIPVITYPDECWHEMSCVQVCPVEGAIDVRIPIPLMLVHK